MAISKDKKQKLVAELTELLSDSKMVVYAKYEGLSVAELQELRRAAREAGVKIKVVKNRLVKVAMKEIAAYTDTAGLTGQLLYSLGTDEDFDAAKVLAKFAKTHPKMELLGGFTGEGGNMSTEEVKTLGALPTKNEMIAQVVDMLLSGVNDVVNALEHKPETAEAQAAAAADKSAEGEQAEKPADTAEADKPAAATDADKPADTADVTPAADDSKPAADDSAKE